ncbi:hypothetical protein [Agromyces sp. Leaf222]|uniref:hypothetical protein n=1 Tax=Agromyces sp. Leaf222 TaxID=1735688 RepID=UPI0006F48D7F|nr:hypothetical protein [Agromyces sp. Leaf222]KQM83088.1 hypothetical protein ASE68_07400 [Agromyces sp. Leaf222]
MELLFVVLGGAILGLGARYLLPLRHTHGVLLIPSIGAGVAAIVWVALTWLGWAWDGGWIWVVSLVVAALASAASAYLIGPKRERADASLFERLSRPATATPTGAVKVG